MEKRVFLAIFLSFGILWVYQTYIVPPPAPVPLQTSAPESTPALTPSATPAETAAVAAELPAALVGDAVARDIVVETDAVRAVFSTEGATLKSWRLKKYFDATGEALELVP